MRRRLSHDLPVRGPKRRRLPPLETLRLRANFFRLRCASVFRLPTSLRSFLAARVAAMFEVPVIGRLHIRDRVPSELVNKRSRKHKSHHGLTYHRSGRNSTYVRSFKMGGAGLESR